MLFYYLSLYHYKTHLKSEFLSKKPPKWKELISKGTRESAKLREQAPATLVIGILF